MYAPTLFGYIIANLLSLIFILPIVLAIGLIIKLITYKLIPVKEVLMPLFYSAFTMAFNGVVFAILYQLLQILLSIIATGLNLPSTAGPVLLILMIVLSISILTSIFYFVEYKFLKHRVDESNKKKMTTLSFVSSLIISILTVAISYSFFSTTIIN